MIIFFGMIYVFEILIKLVKQNSQVVRFQINKSFNFDSLAITATSNTIENCSNEKNWHKLYGIIYAQKQASLRYQTKSSPYFHTAFLPIAPPTHRVLFPDPTNAGPAGFHPFPPAIYRPIPSGIFRK